MIWIVHEIIIAKSRHFWSICGDSSFGYFMPNKKQSQKREGINLIVGHFDVFGVGKTSHETKKPSSKLYGPKISRKLTRENSLHPSIDWLLSRLGLQEIPQNDFITRNRKSLSTVWKLMKHAKTISYFNKVSCIVNCISTLARCERFTVGSSVRLTYRSVL